MSLQEEGTCTSVMVGHVGPVNAVVVDPQGKFAVTGGADGTGRVWGIQTGTCLQLLLGHTNIGEPSRLVKLSVQSRRKGMIAICEVACSCLKIFGGHLHIS